MATATQQRKSEWDYRALCRREQQLLELHRELATLVAEGVLTDRAANEWYNEKAEQWADSPY